jgi:hypothetical protein
MGMAGKSQIADWLPDDECFITDGPDDDYDLPPGKWRSVYGYYNLIVGPLAILCLLRCLDMWLRLW